MTAVSCGSDSSDDDDGSTNTATGGTAATGGSATGGASSSGGASGGANSSGGAGGSGGAAPQGSCAEGSEGIWKIPDYPAYLRIDTACQVTMFCDLDKDYHTTGNLEGDVITLTGVATVNYTLEGDTLTLLDATSTGDATFTRQPPSYVVPTECD